MKENQKEAGNETAARTKTRCCRIYGLTCLRWRKGCRWTRLHAYGNQRMWYHGPRAHLQLAVCPYARVNPTSLVIIWVVLRTL